MDLNFREFGRKSPIVIAHGLFGSASNWQSVAKRLAGSYHIYSVDLRNHGQSPHHDDMSYRAMGEDLLKFIDVHCAGRASLVGHSMGGKAAMAAALIGPQQVERLAVIDIAPVTYDSALGQYAKLMQALPLAEIDRRQTADEWLAKEIPEPMIRAFLLHNLRRNEHGEWHWRLNLTAIVDALPSIAAWPAFDANFVGPTAFIGGGQSDYLQDRYWSSAAPLFPQAQRQLIAGAGHWVHAEKPAEVTEHLIALMQQ